MCSVVEAYRYTSVCRQSERGRPESIIGVNMNMTAPSKHTAFRLVRISAMLSHIKSTLTMLSRWSIDKLRTSRYQLSFSFYSLRDNINVRQPRLAAPMREYQLIYHSARPQDQVPTPFSERTRTPCRIFDVPQIILSLWMTLQSNVCVYRDFITAIRRAL